MLNAFVQNQDIFKEHYGKFKVAFAEDKRNLPVFTSLSVADLKQGQVSNSHSCPKNGIKNWHGNQELPTHYPGWRGRIHIKYNSRNYAGFLTSILEPYYINTGSGGGGEYSFYLYEADWPGLERYYAKRQMISKLKNGHLV